MFIAFLPLVARSDAVVFYGTSEPVEQLPIVVEVPASKAIYLSRIWALQVDNILCDGKRLEVTPAEVIIDENARFTAAVGGSTYIYSCPAYGRWIFAKSLGTNDSPYALSGFSIPEKWRTLKIEYRVRFTDGSFSATTKARFFRLTDEDTWNALHNRPIRRQF